MSKWKCDICKKEFDNFHAQGFDNKIYCPLCFFKEENKRLQQRIDKAIDYIKERTEFNQYSEVYPSVLDAREVKRILEILKGKE